MTMRVSIIADRLTNDILSSRGQQTRRKDKDLMQDTGGTSKGRDREPHSKPPRDDVKKRYRDRRLVPEKRDNDTNENKDREVKKPSRRPMEKKSSEIHPLDRTQTGAWEGLSFPENNYHRQVKSCLHNIFESEQQISEKDFTRQDWIMAETDRLVRTSEAEEIIQRFLLGNNRPSYCAECIFADVVSAK
jgi:hypothetical protein